MYKIIGGDGKEYGPVTVEQLKQWIAEGRASANSKVQALGRMDWQPISAYPEFAEALGLPQATAPPPVRSVQAPVGDIPTHLVFAILATVFCCLPFGIVAIVYSSQVNSKRIAGDIEGAWASSKNAKLWCWLSFGIGLTVTLGWVIVYLVMILGAVGSLGNVR